MVADEKASAVSLQDVDGAGVLLTGSWSGSAGPAPEPMSAETYKDIMTDLDRIHQSLHMEGENQFNEQELALRQDMAQNKAVWCGEFRRDLWYFLINVNPFLASCYSHPLHPITRFERFVVYVMSLVLVTNISAYVAIASLCRPCQYETCGVPEQLNCSDATANFSLVPNLSLFQEEYMPEFCCDSENLGALWFLDRNEFLGGTLYAVLVNIAFTITSFQLIMCPCVQKLTKRRRRFGEILGTLFFAAIAIVTFYYSAPFFKVMYLSDRLWHTIYFFISTKMVSWCGASIFNVIIFGVLFWVQRPKPEGSCLRWMDPPSDFGARDTRCSLIKAVNPRFNVLALEYQGWVRKMQGEGAGVPRILSMQNSPGHSSGIAPLH